MGGFYDYFVVLVLMLYLGFNFQSNLSYDATLEVLSLLSVNDLGRLAQVSKETNAMADDSVVWRRMCRELELEWVKVLNKDQSQVPKLQSEEDWKDAFHKGKHFFGLLVHAI